MWQEKKKFLADKFEVGTEAFYHEDEAKFRVRIEGKERNGDLMNIRLEVLAIVIAPHRSSGAPRVGEILVLSEAKDQSLNSSWTLSND